jgi:autotransporter-associated beta strand protein
LPRRRRRNRHFAALLATTALVAVAALLPGAARAQNATWLAPPATPTGDFNTATNWDTATVPTGTAIFGLSNTTSLSFSANTPIGGWTFDPGASAYTFTNDQVLVFTGAGIVINGGSASITNDTFGTLQFTNSSTAGSASITNNSTNAPLSFAGTSKAGSANITTNSGAQLVFNDSSTAGSATITTNSGGQTYIVSSASGGTARYIMNGTGFLDISGLATAGTTAGSIEGDGVVFLGSKNLAVGGNNLSTTFSGVIQDGGVVPSTGGSLTKTGTGTLILSGTNTYTGGTTINSGILSISSDANLGNTSGGLTFNGGTLQLTGGAANLASTRAITLNAGGGTFDIGGGITTFSQSFGGTGPVTFTNGEVVLSAVNTYSGATTVTSTASLAANVAGALSPNSDFTVDGTLVLEGFNNTIKSLSGSGVVANAAIGIPATLTVAPSSGVTTFSGALIDSLGDALSLAKTGAGTFILSGNNTYSGTTQVSGGTLAAGSTTAFSTTSAFTVNATLDLGGFSNTIGSLAGSGTVTNSSATAATLTAGGNNISTNFSGNLIDGTGALGLTKTGTDTLALTGANTYTGGTTISAGTLQLGDASNTGKIVGAVVNNSVFNIVNADTTGITSITNNGTTGFFNGTSADSATITNNSVLEFVNSSTAGSATITTNSGGTTFIAVGANGGTARFILNGTGALDISALTTGGTIAGSIEGNGNVFLGAHNLAVGGNNLSTTFSGVIQDGGVAGGTGGSLTKTGIGILTLTATNTYTGGTTISGGTLQLAGAGTLGGTTGTLGVSGGTLDLGTTTQTTGALTLTGGAIQNGTLNSSAFGVQAGTISAALAGAGDLTKTGTGTVVLSGINTYTGATTINGGVLEVDGAITSSSGVTVNAGGTLTGTGLVDPPVPAPVATTINSGGTLAPGNGTPGTSMTISGNLAFQSGAQYLVQLNPATASFANVTGTATLGGATVNALYANGSYVAKQYTILTAGHVSGTFGSLVNTNLPSGFKTDLSYDATHAYLDLSLAFIPPPGSGLSGNQQAVGNAIINSFNTSGSIPLVFGGLTPAGLTQLSGETATGSQQTTFDAMGMFMGLLTDPFMSRAGGANPPPGAAGFAAEEQGASAYAARKSGDAYAMFTKAPPAPFVQRWSVWAAGFGGSQSTDGNAALGSNNTTGNIAGTAVGVDYLFSPNTLAGFALAGGGTNFSVAGGGSGRSDLFQAGAYVRHTNGAAYMTAALAYGWQDITTDRTVTVAGFDHLRAEFNANAWSGRLEGGYRFVSPWIGGIGITPYAAAQFVTFDLPAYAEQALTGASTFALAYGSRDVTDTRSELGIRTDKSFAMQDGILTLRGRFAWAHDFNPDRSIAATFQSLPGASFVVNGAAQASDSALTTASIERKWMNGWSVAATFEGEFSEVTRSYAGKGVVRYSW